MIVLFTDFGLEGPYVGQVKAVLARDAPGIPVIDLIADVAPFRPREAGYLLAAYVGAFPEHAVFLCVVDPGVGSARSAVAARIDEHWFVGPGNGLFEPLVRRAHTVQGFAIPVPAGSVSATFHGRDLFAPAAARIALRGATGLTPQPLPRFADWPDDLPAIVYVDRFGNLMTGLRAAGMPSGAVLRLKDRAVTHARTFSDRPPGTPLWYENANGLAEIAVNCGRAVDVFGAAIGDPVDILEPAGVFP